jgi:hypothetical protein
MIRRKQAFACPQQDRIILPTLMLILPGKPPRVLLRFWLARHRGVNCFLRTDLALLVSVPVIGWAAIFVWFVLPQEKTMAHAIDRFSNIWKVLP